MTKKEILAGVCGGLACIVVGICISVLPHLSAWWESGQPIWVADADEVFYLQVGSQAYFNHPFHLADPVRAGQGYSIYKPLPLLPGLWIARVFRLGPVMIGFCWRLWAGLTIGLAWFLLCRDLLGKRWMALALAILLLTDGGVVDGRPLLRQGKIAALLVMGQGGDYLKTKPILHPEWRISTPGVTMTYLILLILALSRARQNPTWPRLVAAGVAYGLLYHVYFYYWTAATIALGMAWILDRGHRRAYFHTSWIGLLVGLPSLVGDFITKQTTSPDWLLRTDKFLPIGRFEELMLPKGAILLVVLTGIIVWSRRRECLFIWTLVVAGLGLMNHQLLTRMQIENFHWNYVWGPCLTLLMLVLVFRELEAIANRSKLKIGIVGSVILVTACAGFWLRLIEARESQDSRALTTALVRFLQEPPLPLEPGATVAGRRLSVDLASIVQNVRPLDAYAVTLSSSVKNDEWDERRALNAVLNGLTRSEYASQETQALSGDTWGPWGRDPALRSERLESRLRAFDRFLLKFDDVLDLWNVRYVIQPVSGLQPPQGGWLARPNSESPTYFERVRP